MYNHTWLKDALRTIGIAYKVIAEDEKVNWEDETEVCGGLTLIGVVGIEDPVRGEGDLLVFILLIHRSYFMVKTNSYGPYGTVKIGK